MAVRRDISDISVVVNGLLTRYVEIHEECFNRPIWHYFKAIDFGGHRADAEQLIAAFQSCRNHLASMVGSDDREREYLETLRQYVESLMRTIEVLGIVLDGLHAKSQKWPSYNWSTYKSDLKNYEQSVDDYTALGARLNTLYRQLQIP